MSDQFNCSMCKQMFEGVPSLVNGCGRFCSECRQKIRDRHLVGTREGSARRARRTKAKLLSEAKKKFGPVPGIASVAGFCDWCGGPKGQSDDNCCNPCSHKKRWLRSCIQVSRAPYEYVARLEQKLGPQRKAIVRMVPAQTADSKDMEINALKKQVQEFSNKFDKLISALGAQKEIS